ncbi:MAG: ArsR/SmtB family transcription factor [Candidatus Methanomethylophilaceae archaeon]
MNEIDALLSMIENPTRRRILEALVREPHYPFQLARELRVSQPAIVKHLRVLEDGGLVDSYEEHSDKGPVRKVYTPKTGFTVIMDLRNGMFTTRVIEPEEGNAQMENEEASADPLPLKKVREEMQRIDQEISELEKARERMMGQRTRMMSDILERLPGNDGAYRHRILLHRILSHPQEDLDQISQSLQMRREECEILLQEMQQMMG